LWLLTMQIDVDLGNDDDIQALDEHLGARGLGINDILAATDAVVARRKGDRLYAYGRGSGGRPIVMVLQRRGSAWRPRTAWPMDDVEQRWWRRQGGR
jgi:hypothetical protein